MSKRIQRILALIDGGVNTSRAVADVLGVKQSTIAVQLSRLADDGAIVRMTTEARDTPGRPFVRWRLPVRQVEHHPV